MTDGCWKFVECFEEQCELKGLTGQRLDVAAPCKTCARLVLNEAMKSCLSWIRKNIVTVLVSFMMKHLEPNHSFVFQCTEQFLWSTMQLPVTARGLPCARHTGFVIQKEWLSFKKREKPKNITLSNHYFSSDTSSTKLMFLLSDIRSRSSIAQ